MWFKFPLKAMREVGPAVQTLSALLTITSNQTFTATSEISQRARLPLKTVYKHLATLHEMGWIENKHREKTRSGWLEDGHACRYQEEQGQHDPLWFSAVVGSLQRRL